MSTNDKDLQEAKKLNQKSGQGNISSSASSTDFTSYNSAGTQQARQLNAQSGSSGSTSGPIDTTNYNSPDTQQARQFNAQSGSGSSVSSGVSSSSDLEEAKKQNEKSKQNKGK